ISNSVEMTGECLRLADQGIGYWFLTWAPTEAHDAVAEEWASARKGFSLLKEREGWSEKQAKRLTLHGNKARYTLGYNEGLWTEQEDAKAYDADADRALLGRDPTEPKGADKTATALVLLLPKQQDLKAALAAVRDHVSSQVKKLYPDAVIENADGNLSSEDRPPDEIGNVRGQVLELRVHNKDGFEHF